MWEQLMAAIEAGDAEEATRLIAQIDGAELKKVNNYGYTALHFAAKNGWKEVCELLISKMTPEALNVVNKHRQTALHFAAKNGWKEVCELLISKINPEAIDRVDKYGYTMLHLAARQGWEKACELLIQKMSPEAINVVNSYGYTALNCAVERGYKEVCELLIQKMSPEAINYVNGFGKTALHCAAQGKHQEIAEMLIKKMGLEEVSKYINNPAIQNVLNKMVISFIDQKDFTQPLATDDYFKLKLYQLVKAHHEKSNSGELLLLDTEAVDNYIDTHYFKLIVVCKSGLLREELPLEINILIFHFAQCEFGYGVDSAGDTNVVGDTDLSSDHPS